MLQLKFIAPAVPAIGGFVMAMSEDATRISQIVNNLKEEINQLNLSFRKVKDLILELARILDESGHCGRRIISRKIKEMLADKIQEGKITTKWIHDCLPSEYKREYKREVTSLSDIDIKRNGLDTDSQSDGSVIVQQIDGNAVHNNNNNNNESFSDIGEGQDAPNKEQIKSNIELESRESNQTEKMHDTEDNKIVTGREHDSDESQILEEELSRKTELIAQLQLQIEYLSDQLKERKKNNDNNNGMDNIRSDSKNSDTSQIATRFEFPILFEDLRQCLEDIFRITKGVGKIWIRVQVHGKNVIMTFTGGSKEHQIRLPESSIRTKVSE